jgi:glycolate oxidase
MKLNIAVCDDESITLKINCTYVEELSKKYSMRILSFGHAGDGNCHVYILRDQLPKDKWRSMVEECMDEMYRMGFELGGNVSGEHGIGVAKRQYLAMKAGEDHMSLMRGIKQSFDPKGILNPGKIV